MSKPFDEIAQVVGDYIAQKLRERGWRVAEVMPFDAGCQIGIMVNLTDSDGEDWRFAVRAKIGTEATVDFFHEKFSAWAQTKQAAA